MKTRRILAASTAAVLAATSAAVVAYASAAAPAVTSLDVTTTKAAADATVAKTDVAATVTTLNVTISGFETDATLESTVTAAKQYKVAGLTAAEMKTDGSLVGTIAVTNEDTSKVVTVTEWDTTNSATKDVKYTITLAFAAAASSDSSAASSDTSTASNTSNTSTTSGTTSTTTPAAAPKTLNKIEEDKATSIGPGVKITLSEKDVEKFEEEKYEKYNLTATAEVVEDKLDNGKYYVETGDDANSAVKGLDKTLKKEIAKIESKNFKIINIDLADDNYVESTSPVAIKITVTLDQDYKVYHVSGKTVEKLKSSSRKLTDGAGYEISFTTKNFSPFIFTTADLKNAGSTTSDGEPTSAAATSSGTSTTNPDTGIALAIAPVVLAAGAVAVVALKKKH